MKFLNLVIKYLEIGIILRLVLFFIRSACRIGKNTRFQFTEKIVIYS